MEIIYACSILFHALLCKASALHNTRHGVQALWVGQDVESIYVTNLPSLITLLSRLGTIVGNAQIPGEEL